MAGNIGIVASAFSSRSVSRGRFRLGKITVCTEGFSRDLAREAFPAIWRGRLFPRFGAGGFSRDLAREAFSHAPAR